MFFFLFFSVVFGEMITVSGECMYRKKQKSNKVVCVNCVNCVVSPKARSSLPLSLSPQSQQTFRFAPRTLHVHYTTLHYTTLHYTTLYYTTVTTLNYTMQTIPTAATATAAPRAPIIQWILKIIHPIYVQVVQYTSRSPPSLQLARDNK